MVAPAPGDDATSLTLLGRLRSAAPDAKEWTDFVARYGPQVDRWCRRWGLQGADAEDVTQVVLTRIARRIREFERQGPRSFRGYLRTVAHFAWQDLIADRQRAAVGSGRTSMVDRLGELAAREDLEARLADAYDAELLEIAESRVRERVEVRTWEAFRLSAVDGLPGAEVSARTGMEVATVYKARSKVQKMLREEIEKLSNA